MDTTIPPADSFYEPGDTLADPVGDLLPAGQVKEINPSEKSAWTSKPVEQAKLPVGAVRIKYNISITNSDGEEIFVTDDYDQVHRNVDFPGSDNRAEELLLNMMNSMVFNTCRRSIISYSVDRAEIGKEDDEDILAPVTAAGMQYLPPMQPAAPLNPPTTLDDESEEDKAGKA